MNSIQDKDLLFQRISKGDKKAFDVFFAQYYPKLIQFARVFIDSGEQAEDIVSDVLTKMLIEREKVFIIKNFEAYLYTSIKNKALSSIRKRQVATRYSTEESNQPQKNFTFVSPHDLLVEQEFQRVIFEVIDGFPPKRKMVFHLIREEGLSYGQVAELLDISVRTVEVHLRLAIKVLRKSVEAYLVHDVMNLVEN